MTKNTVKNSNSISVRIGTTATRIQLIKNPNGDETFRPRINRKFIGKDYLTREQIAVLVVGIAMGDTVNMSEPEDFRKFTQCRVRKILDGREHWTQFNVLSEPVRLYCGEWYVFGNAVGWGRGFYKTENIKMRAK